MSGVDVLAVMDRAFGAANEHYYDLRMDAGEAPLGPAYERACRYMKEHREARAAVAELIEAAEAVARIQINRRTPANDLGKAKQVRLRAALSRVRGAE